jgi:hypothetical protein
MILRMHRDSTAARPFGERYEIQQQLAAGGMGVIHRAYDRLARREVAYKRLVVVSESSRARVTQLFQREYETLARLAHPNIVETFDYGQDASGPYYTMELLTGHDLIQVAPQPYREACRVLRDVASALALVHARRLVHRDVSPGNIRLTLDGRAKLIDFGALTPFGTPEELVGTASCMAPECLSNAPLDQRTDLYSLGAVAYWLLTRQTSVRARQIKELPDAWKEPVAPPSLLVPEIPKELDALVLSLLAHDPLARPSHAAYVIERLTTIGDLGPEADERRVAYSYLAHPPLAGRVEALAALRDRLDQTAAGRGSVTLVEGRPGLGRSALLETVALGAQLDGFVVLRARGSRLAGPFGLARKLTDFAYALRHDLGPARSRGQSFLSLVPPLRAQTAADVAAHHARVVESVRGVLLELSKSSPVLVVVDELDASDPESLAVLALLREELASHTLSVVGSVLAGAATEESPGLSLLKAGAKRVLLAPLSEVEVVQLVQSVFGDVPNTRRLGAWLHAESGGNPATAMDLARLLLARDSIRYTLGTFTLPHTLQSGVSSEELASAVLARLGNLGPHARRVASALCLHQGGLTPEQLATALELAPREVMLSLEELGARDLVGQQDGAFQLTANSLRGPLAKMLPDDARQALHVSLARAFLAHGQGLAESHFQASTHLLHGGRETEAAELVAGMDRTNLDGPAAARWVVVIEAVLAVFARQKRSKEQQLALLIPLMHGGFQGQLAAQRRHVEQALEWMSQVCGMTLARRLRPALGGKLSLLVGLAYAVLRRALTPASKRLGTLPEMLAEFVGLVSASTASAVTSDETPSALRWNEALEPLSALPPHTSGYLLREFCLATVEVGVGEFTASVARYGRLMPQLLKPIDGLDDALRLTIYRGCLNGSGQAALQMPGDDALRFAEELAGAGDPFFAPHAEGARMGYYAYRGYRDQAEHHRARAETLAMRGGDSWSAEMLVAKRQVITGILTRDAIGLLQARAAIERLRELAPKMQRYAAFCAAWLEFLHGRPEDAVTLYEPHIQDPQGHLLYTWRFDRACYAALLNAAGQHARAKVMCEEVLQGRTDASNLHDMRHFSLQQLALAEVGLGNVEEGTHLLDRYVTYTESTQNPLLIGDAHRDRAQLALRQGEGDVFERHFEAMARAYRETRNPSLIQQCDKLAAQAAEQGLRPPASWLLGTSPENDSGRHAAGEMSAVRLSQATEIIADEVRVGERAR